MNGGFNLTPAASNGYEAARTSPPPLATTSSSSSSSFLPTSSVDKKEYGKKRRTDLITILLFSMLYTVNIGVSNVSLSMVSLPFHQVVRSTNPAITLALERLLFGKKVITGVALATLGEYEFSMPGLLMTLLGVLLSSLKGICTNRLLVGTLKLHPLDLLWRMSGLASMQCMLVSVWSGEYSAFLKFARSLGSATAAAIPKHRRTLVHATVALLHTNSTLNSTVPNDNLTAIGPMLENSTAIMQGPLPAPMAAAATASIMKITAFTLFAALFVNGLLAFFLNFVSFVANRRVGALSMTVAGNVKQSMTIGLSVWIFGYVISGLNGIGILLTLIGGAWYRQQQEVVMDESGEDEGGGLSRLMVSVRIRPLSMKERQKESYPHPITQPVDSETVLIIDPTEDHADVLRQDRPKEKLYGFDQVFSETAEQIEVFENTTMGLIPGVLKGYNATVFAYGATGAGKTYTMLGTETSPGIMSNTLSHLFTQISSLTTNVSFYEVTLSYLEIYNENIRDLLAGRPDYLELREDASHGVVVSGITTVVVRSADEVMAWLKKGNRMRTQEATGANEVSSRSHAVLQVLVGHRMDAKDGHRTERFGKLSMIDLAGSERAADTKNRGLRMIEGANINRSLLALGNCINALGDTNKRAKYVNYRDSKLTRLLKV
ncbi:Kinesin-like protein kif19 [Phlyctochytrium planicorne]|nr:Kinesin-like protein kif19 [Phlyctochytrium planicorne]